MQQQMSILNWLYMSTVDCLLLPTKDTKKSTIAKRVGQITPMCDPKTNRAYCCTKPNWICSSRLWSNMPRPHSLGLLAYIFAAREKNAVRCFRGKIFSREDIFAGSDFRGKIFLPTMDVTFPSLNRGSSL